MIIPSVTVRIDGSQIDAHVLSLRVSAKLSQPAQAEVTLGGVARGWPMGARLELEVGEESLFDGDVTAIELVHGPGSERAWLLRGYDRLHRLRKRQEPRVFEDVTVEKLARALTGDLDISIDCADAGPRFTRLVQHNQSDWDLLRQTASRAGRYLSLDGSTLRITSLRPSDPIGKLEAGTTLWQARAESNMDRLVPAVTALGWHPQRGELMTGKAGTAGAGSWTLVAQPHENLDATAQAMIELSTARGIHIEGVTHGDASLKPGQSVTICGLNEAIDGDYPLCQVVHTVNAEGYRARISTEPPPLDAVPAGAAITLGKVTSVADPDGLGRVEITLPAYGGVGIGWLSVLCPGAGPGKGIVALPDPGDLVVVALPHENPADGIVLGSLFGTQSPPDTGVSGNAVTRWTLKSSAGQNIIIDDSEKSLKLSNADGSELELAPGQVTLRARTDMLIEAPGHNIAIRAASIDFEHAMLPVVLP
jgi:phage protein D/phage baseplate assembly protein gpV